MARNYNPWAFDQKTGDKSALDAYANIYNNTQEGLKGFETYNGQVHSYYDDAPTTQASPTPGIPSSGSNNRPAASGGSGGGGGAPAAAPAPSAPLAGLQAAGGGSAPPAMPGGGGSQGKDIGPMPMGAVEGPGGGGIGGDAGLGYIDAPMAMRDGIGNRKPPILNSILAGLGRAVY